MSAPEKAGAESPLRPPPHSSPFQTVYRQPNTYSPTPKSSVSKYSSIVLEILYCNQCGTEFHFGFLSFFLKSVNVVVILQNLSQKILYISDIFLLKPPQIPVTRILCLFRIYSTLPGGTGIGCSGRNWNTAFLAN